MKNVIQHTASLLLILFTLGVSAQVDSSSTDDGVILDTKGIKIIVKEKTTETTTNEAGDTIRRKKEVIEITTTRDETDREEDVEPMVDLERIIKEFKEDEYEPQFIETSWNKFHLGLNNLINKEGKLETESGYGNMEISASNSINFQWDIVTQAMNLYKQNVRLVYGIGIDYNNYRFKQDVTLNTDSLPLLLGQDAVSYKKNKLVTQYLNVPLMLNFKLSPKKSDENLYISAGANFGYLIGSHQKQVWEDNGKRKNKTRDDYNLEKFRVGYEVQFGFKNIILYGKYFPKSIFQENKGPELRTVSAGILIGKV